MFSDVINESAQDLARPSKRRHIKMEIRSVEVEKRQDLK